MSAAAPPQPAPPRPHFKLFGFPVRINPFFLFIAVIIGLPGQDAEWNVRTVGEMLIVAAIVFVSVMWHELGHALVMRRLGFKPSIMLHGLGGATSWGPGPPTSPGQRIAVSAAGPGFGFLLGLVFVPFALLLPSSTPWAVKSAVDHLAWLNVFWSVLNLVPMVPWDGGHILEGVFDLFTNGRGRKPAAMVSIVVAVLIAAALLWAAGSGALMLLLLCGLSVMHAVRIIRAEQARLPASEELRRARLMLEHIGPPAALVSAAFRGQAETRDRWVALAGHLERFTIPQLETPAQRAEARELAAWSYLMANDITAAARTVETMRTTHDPSPLLAGVLFARAGDGRAALAAMDAMGEGDSPGARDLVTAYASASLGEVDAALEALGDDDAARKKGAWIDASLFYAEQFDAAARLGEALFDRFRHVEDAYNAACSHARAGHLDDALRMLEAAVDAGYLDLEQLESDADMKAVRAHEAYPALRARLERAST